MKTYVQMDTPPSLPHNIYRITIRERMSRFFWGGTLME